jgi:hypothetical protein
MSNVKSEETATISDAPLDVTAMKQMTMTSTAPPLPSSTYDAAGMTRPCSASVVETCRGGRAGVGVRQSHAGDTLPQGTGAEQGRRAPFSNITV